MRNFSKIVKFTGLIAAVVLAVGCLTLEPEVVREDCRYAGMYSVLIKGVDSRTKEYTEQDMTYFEVTNDWKVIGSSDDGGYSGFTGDIQEDGSFSAEISMLPGSIITGNINEDGIITGVQELGEYGTYELEGSRD